MAVADRPHSTTSDRFSITPRILAILSNVARYGLLSSEQIARIDGGSRQKITRFLQKLVELKLLRRLDTAPEVFLASFFDARPRTYAITHKGLRCLEAADMSLNVTPKKTAVQIAHELETAEFMFAVNAAVAAHGELRLIDQPELISAMPPATQAMAKPLELEPVADPRDFPHLSDILKKPTKIRVQPDRLIAIAFSDNRGFSFLIERCRATEDIRAKRIKGKTTHFRKCLAYASAWLAGKHIEQWGEMCKALRVLTITTSDTRIQHMIETQQYVMRGAAGLFLYSTPERIQKFGALGPAWMSAKRDGISLLDRD